MAPFSPLYFFSGCENSTLQLHSRFYEKSLISLRSLDETNKIEPSIDVIEWSNIRPCVLFVKNSRNFIHIWDLKLNDMSPLYSTPFQEKITDIKLSPVINEDTGSTTYLVSVCVIHFSIVLLTLPFGIILLKGYSQRRIGNSSA